MRLKGLFVKRLAQAVIFGLLLTPCSAHANFQRCCLKKARELAFKTREKLLSGGRQLERNSSTISMIIDLYPFYSCGINELERSRSPDQALDSVNITFAKCREECPGFQPTPAEDWVQAVGAWILPALAFLCLCPPEEEEEAERATGAAGAGTTSGRGKKFWKLSKSAYIWLRGYVKILSDPASAMGGAFMDLAKDYVLVRDFHRLPDSEEGSAEKKNRIAMVVLAGHLKFKDPGKPATESKPDSKKIVTLLAAKHDFVGGIFVPCVLGIATGANAFYDAYKKLGDKTTALNLSYGVWYNWLLVLSVVCHCSIAASSGELAQKAFEEQCKPGDPVPLRDRYPNLRQWRNWLDEEPAGSESKKYSPGFYLKYLIGQTLGWVLVTFFASCAVLIAYTTPQVGLGCRSLNFIMYSVVSLLIAWLSVVRHWVENKTNSNTWEATLVENKTNSNTWEATLKYLHYGLGFVNFLILVLGSALHLAGVLTTCRCSNLLAGPNDTYELAPYTDLAIKNATRYWLLIGHLSYSISWVIIVISVTLMRQLSRTLEKHYKKQLAASSAPTPAPEQLVTTAETKTERVSTTIEVEDQENRL